MNGRLRSSGGQRAPAPRTSGDLHQVLEAVGRNQGLHTAGTKAYASFYWRLLGKAASMVDPRSRRPAAIAVCLCALSVLAAACASDDHLDATSTDGPAHGSSASSSQPVPESTPTPDSDDWRTKYSSAQLKAYEAALRRWESYESRSEPIWAKGKASEAARSLFKEFFPHPAWDTQFEQLETYDKYGVQIAGTPRVLWSRANSVSDADDGVQIEQCVDYRSTTTTQNGELTALIESRQEPVLREITLNKPAGYDWLIYAINTTPGGGGAKDRPCPSIS